MTKFPANLASAPSPSASTSIDTPIRRLALVLRAESDALVRGDLAAAAGLLTEKRAAAAALQALIPGATPDPRTAAQLRDLAIENAAELTRAIEVQGRILEMVARAARAATPGAVRYGAQGAATSNMGALALTLRA